jgi:hypothetical protein
MMAEDRPDWRSMNAEYNHRPEFVVMGELNTRLASKGVMATRPTGDMARYTPQDLYLHTFDPRSLTHGMEICRIDVERKANNSFTDYPNPPRGWHSWSFLARKVDKGSNRERDVYVLVDREVSDRIFWITFGAIRAGCDFAAKVDGWGVRDRFYRCPVDTPIAVQRGYDSLCRYIAGLRDGRADLSTFGVTA